MTVYSKDLRRRIVETYEAGEDSVRGLAERFSVSPTTVEAYVHLWRETGDVEPRVRRNGPRPRILDAHLDRLRDLVDEQNDATLEQYAARYSARHGVPIRKSALARAFHRARLTRKKKTLSASEADSEPIQRARERFRRRARSRRHRRFVFIDEFGFNRATGRRYARAQVNERAHGTQPVNADPNMTLVVGLTTDGPVAPLMFAGAMDGHTFGQYVEQCLAPQLSTGDVVVWDGLGAHRVDAARQAVERRGAEVLPLPGYSPDLNPDEELGSKLKTLARGQPHDTAEQIIDAVGWAYRHVSSSDAQGWFSHRASYLDSS